MVPQIGPPQGDATGALEEIYERLLAVRDSQGDSDQLDELLAALSDPAVPLSRKAIIVESLVEVGDSSPVR